MSPIHPIDHISSVNTVRSTPLVLTPKTETTIFPNTWLIPRNALDENVVEIFIDLDINGLKMLEGASRKFGTRQVWWVPKSINDELSVIIMVREARGVFGMSNHECQPMVFCSWWIIYLFWVSPGFAMKQP